MKLCILLLTCANEQEANNISGALLDNRLVACVKKMGVQSSSLWKGKKESGSEVMLVMDSIEENFTKVNQKVKELHSYETYVLLSLPVNQTTKEVKKWLTTELKNNTS